MKTEIKMPTININDDTVSLVRWIVPDGVPVSEGQPICEVETSKAIEEVLSPSTGCIRICQRPGDVATGSTIAYLTDAQSDEVTASESVSSELPGPTQQLADIDVSELRFTTAARALIEELNIPEAVFHGRVLVRTVDVIAYQAQGTGGMPQLREPSAITQQPRQPSVIAQSQLSSEPVSPSQRRAALRQSPSQPLADIPQPFTRLTSSDRLSNPVSKRKREEIRVLRDGHRDALPSVLTQLVDITGLRSYLMSLCDRVTITLSSIVTYEVARLLVSYKEFNAAYVNDEIVYHKEIHVGMAIDGQFGLKVAAVAQAHEKTVVEIADEMETLLELYSVDGLPMTALTSATFNVSDLTHLSVPWFTPLISRNQSAILGLGLLEFAHREVLSLTLTFDHRVTEGKRAAEFLKELKSRLSAYVTTAGTASGLTQVHTPPSCSRCLRRVDELPGDAKFLVKVMDTSGHESMMCKSCIEGW